jgi:hypothetical protein
MLLKFDQAVVSDGSTQWRMRYYMVRRSWPRSMGGDVWESENLIVGKCHVTRSHVRLIWLTKPVLLYSSY